MKRSSSTATEADQVWQQLSALVTEDRGEWRRRVSELTGLPFSRWRALKRLVDAPLTLRELAEAMNADAPATTVAVNDLERQGWVERRPHPGNARAKLVSITPAGRRVMDRTLRLPDPAPPGFAALSSDDLETLGRILGTIATHSAKPR